jgi:putative transposase
VDTQPVRELLLRLGGLVERNITGDDLIDEHDRIAAVRGGPAVLRCDNGPTRLRRDGRLGRRAGRPVLQSAREPWRNGDIESFNSRICDECLNINIFRSMSQARVAIADWKEDYNHRRHSSLGYQAPAVYAATCTHQ